MLSALEFFLLILVAPAVSPLVFIGLVRRLGVEELRSRAVHAVVYGALIATVIVILLNAGFILGLRGIAGSSLTSGAILLALVFAPFSEEFAKSAGLWLGWPSIGNPAEGFALGVAAGFGFAAAEVFGIAVVHLAEGGAFDISALSVVLTGFAAFLLHGTATGILGYGIGPHVARTMAPRLLFTYLIAVGLHASFNFLFSLGEGLSPLPLTQNAGAATAVGFGGLAFWLVLRRVKGPTSR
ncbi:MAG: PrsW family glutamic-type intramembrane protease [Thermoplasmata archaeon]